LAFIPDIFGHGPVKGTGWEGIAGQVNCLQVALPYVANKDFTDSVFGVPITVSGNLYLTRIDVSVVTDKDLGTSRHLIVPIKDAGPWNIFDDYWDGSRRDRRGFQPGFLGSCDVGTQLINLLNSAQLAGRLPHEVL
jgi:hypothetical protein